MRKVVLSLLLLCGGSQSLRAVIATPTTITTFSPGTTGGNSAAGLDTTGYDLIIIAVSGYAARLPTTMSDNNGNTYSFAEADNTDTQNSAIYYKQAPITGTNTQFTITCNGGACYPACIVAGTSGVATNPLDQHTQGTTASETSIQLSNITPTTPNQIVFSEVAAGAALSVNVTVSGDSFTKLTGVDYNGVNIAAGLGYVIQTTAAGAQPTWSYTGSTIGGTSVIASFKAFVAASNPTRLRIPLGRF